MCLTGESQCPKGHSRTTLSQKSWNVTFCCSNSWKSSESVFSFPDNIICRCNNNSAPVLPPGAYVVPLSGDYNSSGEFHANCQFGLLLGSNGIGLYTTENSSLSPFFFRHESLSIHTELHTRPVVFMKLHTKALPVELLLESVQSLESILYLFG